MSGPIQRHDKPVERAGGVLEDCFPLFIANDGYTKQEGDGETTSTCFCGGVQYVFVSFSLITTAIVIVRLVALADCRYLYSYSQCAVKASLPASPATAQIAVK